MNQIKIIAVIFSLVSLTLCAHLPTMNFDSPDCAQMARDWIERKPGAEDRLNALPGDQRWQVKTKMHMMWPLFERHPDRIVPFLNMFLETTQQNAVADMVNFLWSSGVTRNIKIDFLTTTKLYLSELSTEARNRYQDIKTLLDAFEDILKEPTVSNISGHTIERSPLWGQYGPTRSFEYYGSTLLLANIIDKTAQKPEYSRALELLLDIVNIGDTTNPLSLAFCMDHALALGNDTVLQLMLNRCDTPRRVRPTHDSSLCPTVRQWLKERNYRSRSIIIGGSPLHRLAFVPDQTACDRYGEKLLQRYSIHVLAQPDGNNYVLPTTPLDLAIYTDNERYIQWLLEHCARTDYRTLEVKLKDCFHTEPEIRERAVSTLKKVFHHELYEGTPLQSFDQRAAKLPRNLHGVAAILLENNEALAQMPAEIVQQTVHIKCQCAQSCDHKNLAVNHFMIAAAIGKVPQLQVLLARNLTPLARDPRNRSALHYACTSYLPKSKVENVRFLASLPGMIALHNNESDIEKLSVKDPEIRALLHNAGLSLKDPHVELDLDEYYYDSDEELSDAECEN